MVRHAGMQEPVEPPRNVVVIDLDQHAVACNFTAGRYGASLKRCHVVCAVTAPQAGNGHGLVRLKPAIDHEWFHYIEMGAQRRALFCADGMAHV